MSLFMINEEKCQRDGICAESCPMGLIVSREGTLYPAAIDGAERLCVHCGHCVAVCPRGALSLEDIKPDQCPPIQRDLQLTPEQAEHFLRSRRSIRVYKKESVHRKLIEKIIRIARYAPSGHNSQPVQWLVIYERAEIQMLAGMVVDWMRSMLTHQPDFANFLHMDRVVERWNSGGDPVCRSAPHMIVAHASKEDRRAPVAAAIALTYLELAAHSFGLGACWAGYFNAAVSFWPPMQKALALPGDNISLGAMMVGYPKYRYHRLPSRKESRITWR